MGVVVRINVFWEIDVGNVGNAGRNCDRDQLKRVSGRPILFTSKDNALSQG